MSRTQAALKRFVMLDGSHPEFIVDKRRHQLLHGQTALLVKRHLLFEPGVVVASVPYQLGVPEDSVLQGLVAMLHE